MQTYLVSGGAGFIGSHLCERLLDLGDRVICVDNLITGSEQNISSLKKNKNFVFFRHDITKRFSKEILNSPFGFAQGEQFSILNFIYHLASPASPNKHSPRSYINHPVETLLVNSIGTYNLLELAREKNARFVYASSSEVYGNPSVSPQQETYLGNVNPIGPRSVYDEGKRFGESMVMTYFRKYNLDIRIVRIFNTYGERMQKDDGRAISNFIMQAIANAQITIYGDGSQTRSFCYVLDMIDGLIKAMEIDRARGNVINLGNPQEITILEVARLIKKLVGSKSAIVFEDLPEDDPIRRKPDIQRAKKILGFEPRVSLEEGLIKTIKYFKMNK